MHYDTKIGGFVGKRIVTVVDVIFTTSINRSYIANVQALQPWPSALGQRQIIFSLSRDFNSFR